MEGRRTANRPKGKGLKEAPHWALEKGVSRNGGGGAQAAGWRIEWRWKEARQFLL